ANFKQGKGDYSGNPNWINSNETETYLRKVPTKKALVWNSKTDKGEFRVTANIVYDTLANGKIIARNIPGTLNQLAIRGTNSINSKHEPLFILDGKPISQKEMQVLNPNDIKEITVLKDASATSIYGSR